MTATHSTLLHQFFSEALPIMERSLDVRDDFSALQKAVTAKGMDWGQIKALARAVAEDARKDDGNKRVDRIIEKADFASAYADMLGLGTPKMNENNFSADLPPHDEDGVIIEPASAPYDAEAGQEGEDEESTRKSSSVAPPIIPDVPANGPATAPAPGAGGITPAKGDAGEPDASPAISPAKAPEPSHSEEADPQVASSLTLSPSGERGATKTDGGSHEVANPDSDTTINGTDFRFEDPDDMSRRASGSVSIPQSRASSPAPDAPVERSAACDQAPGAHHSGVMPDLPDFLNRKLMVEAAA